MEYLDQKQMQQKSMVIFQLLYIYVLKHIKEH